MKKKKLLATQPQVISSRVLFLFYFLLVLYVCIYMWCVCVRVSVYICSSLFEAHLALIRVVPIQPPLQVVLNPDQLEDEYRKHEEERALEKVSF